MATTTNLLTWKEFEQLPDEHLEIIEGELIALPPPKSGLSNIAANTAELLRPLKANRSGRVLCEAGYKLSEDPATWIQPDVSFLKMEQVHHETARLLPRRSGTCGRNRLTLGNGANAETQDRCSTRRG